MKQAPDEAPDAAAVPETETEPLADHPCKVILFNDEDHTYDYVVEMLSQTCRLTRENAFRCAVEVDLTGRTTVYYGPRASCDSVCAKIRAYGPDHRLPQSMTSMRSEVQGC